MIGFQTDYHNTNINKILDKNIIFVMWPGYLTIFNSWDSRVITNIWIFFPTICG